MKRPSSVRVLGKDFAIDYIAEQALDHSCVGNTEPQKLKIAIQDKLPRAFEQDVIFHEVTHALEKSLGLDMTELQVNALAAGWVQVLRDNPQLAKYFASL